MVFFGQIWEWTWINRGMASPEEDIYGRSRVHGILAFKMGSEFSERLTFFPWECMWPMYGLSLLAWACLVYLFSRWCWCVDGSCKCQCVNDSLFYLVVI